MTVGEDFFSFSCDFQNLTFCGSQPGNLVGGYWVNWPTSQWGARAKVHTSAETYAQIGVYQVNPNYVDDGWARRNGWKLNNPGGTTGALIPLEFGWMPTIEGRPGTYRAGVWYNTSNGKDLYEDVNGNARGITGLDGFAREIINAYRHELAAKLLAQKGSGRALISICAAGGQGVTAILER